MGNGERLLLVENNAADELLVVDALRSSGFEQAIDVARDGAEALEYLFASDNHVGQGINNPQLVILGWTPPRVSAAEVLTRLREHQRTRLIPVVVLGSSTDEAEIRTSYLYGANSYVRKPAEFGQFVDTVQNIAAYWLKLNETACM
jgi:two-component system response regulator